MTAHGFPRQGRTRKGERYDSEHRKARAAAAAQHRPSDRCARCQKPLGPMGPGLHYDHDEHGGYLGFSHAVCNRKAGASKGGQILAARTAGIRLAPRTCSICKARFTPRVSAQRACSHECREVLAGIGRRQKRIKAVPRGVQGQMRTCPICGGLHTRRGTTCSPACSAEASARQMRDRYRIQHGIPVDPAQPTRPSRRSLAL